MELSFKLKKAPEFIFDYLTNMQKFVAVHPVIFQIDNLGNENYLVHETLKFGPIPFTFTYPVTIEKSEANRSVTIRATVMKLTKIEMKFVLKSSNEFTIVEENILFKSYLPIKSIMQNIFRKQHTQLFKNIDEL